QPLYLGDRGGDIPGIGVGHRLYCDRRITAYINIPDADFPRLFPYYPIHPPVRAAERTTPGQPTTSLRISLYAIYMPSRIIMMNPASDIMDSFSGLSGFPLTASTPISRSRPPSSAGKGRRFV